MPACANMDKYFCVLLHNYAEIERWEVSLNISNQLEASEKYLREGRVFDMVTPRLLFF